MSFSVTSASDTLSEFPVKIGQSFSEVQTMANQYGYQLERANHPMAAPGSYEIIINQKSIGSLGFKNGLLSYASIGWLNSVEHFSLDKLYTALDTVSKGRPTRVELAKSVTPSSRSSSMRFFIENSNLSILVIIHEDGQDRSVQIIEILD